MKYASDDESHEGNMNVSIKKGKKSHIEKYLSVFNECKHEAYISHGEVLCGRATHDLKWADDITAQMEEGFNGYLENNETYILFEILLSGELVGFAVLELYKETKAAVLSDIMIKRKGEGIGAEALRNIEAYLKAENIEILLLESGIQNKAAHDFFEKNGFTQISVEYSKRLR